MWEGGHPLTCEHPRMSRVLRVTNLLLTARGAPTATVSSSVSTLDIRRHR